MQELDDGFSLRVDSYGDHYTKRLTKIASAQFGDLAKTVRKSGVTPTGLANCTDEAGMQRKAAMRAYDVRSFGYDPYNAKDFVERWCTENGPFGVEKVIQGAKTESVPLGELKKLSEQRKLLFDEALMQFAMGNCITLEDTNGNRKLLKRRSDQKIDAVAAMMDAYIAWKLNRDAFE